MLDIRFEPGGRVVLSGRLDASQVHKARSVLDTVLGSVVIDCSGLDYISSAGISVLLVTLKRLQLEGHSLTLSHVQGRIMNVLRYSGLDRIFTVE